MPEQVTPYRRVIVIGSPGAGKSSLGLALARRLRLPFVDLDDEYWRAGWTEPDEETWRAQVRALAERPEWVMAGNYGGTLDLRAGAADLVVLMDLPRALCVWRLLLRSVKIRLGRQTWRLPRDCRAGPDWEPMREYPAFLRYTWRFPRDSRPRTLEAVREQGVHRVIHLRSGREARRLQQELASRATPSAVLASWLVPLPQ